ncbi:hypothetical protein GOODEAATRI_023300 [Goodea atripinnis]|uniref:Secreted protein n=1 Tax=Goodea atripinnis TaxID=208336 RepID=A0ABV0Q140_9TELE
MARLNWCLAAVISWGKFLFTCFFPLRGAKRNKHMHESLIHRPGCIYQPSTLIPSILRNVRQCAVQDCCAQRILRFVP